MIAKSIRSPARQALLASALVIRVPFLVAACLFGLLATACFAIESALAGDIIVERIKTRPTHE